MTRIYKIISLCALSLAITACGTSQDLKSVSADHELRLNAIDAALNDTQDDVKRLSQEMDILGSIVEDLSEIILKKQASPAQMPLDNLGKTGSGTVTRTRAGFDSDKTRLVLDFSQGANIQYHASAESDDKMHIILPGIGWSARTEWTAKRPDFIKAYHIEKLSDRTVMHIDTAGTPLSVKIFELPNPSRLVIDFSRDN